ncbi:putative glucose repressible Grg1 [Fusarium pseudoanthophilum]|uniref:Putative glucose repressible Grg1 n=1 Tax=Fusarium pseudoanthophilum TaxID=48495 RepID=A0A8H5KH41_9HYPO|nr:putative glucose repressible Grg1 [Fusarium pseudoanthophilum]
MDSIKNTVNQATEKVQEGLSGTSKEANKEVAKDSNAGIGTRASAAKDAASDKMDETKHSAKSEGYSAQNSQGAPKTIEHRGLDLEQTKKKGNGQSEAAVTRPRVFKDKELGDI